MATSGTALSASVLRDYHTKAYSSGVNLSDVNLNTALLDVANSESPTNWATCTYASDDPQRLILCAQGTDGFVGLLGCLREDIVVYGAFLARCGSQIKRIFVSWVGSAVKPLERARVSMHRTDVMNHFEPVCSFEIPEGESADAICESVLSAIHAQLSAVQEHVPLNSNDEVAADEKAETPAAQPSEFDALASLVDDTSSGAAPSAAELAECMVRRTGRCLRVRAHAHACKHVRTYAGKSWVRAPSAQKNLPRVTSGPTCMCRSARAWSLLGRRLSLPACRLACW